MRKAQNALPRLVEAFRQSVEAEAKKADEVFAAMPAQLTAGQRKCLRQKAASCRETAKKSAEFLLRDARFYERLAKGGKLNAKDRRLLRITLANIESLRFVRL